ncbi:SDR family NAD(P)-dependent oxidoreductase [Candidatus Pelagibacter sp.]|nr:SDR family NAD(P)-dependent oxidoreductase [Candidatus Pelagibacter sp.]
MIKEKNILVYGSNSDLSHELLKKLAPENNLFLVSKNLKKLDENRDYFKNISSNKIINYCADLNDLNTSNQILDKYFSEFDSLDYVFFFQGYMNKENLSNDEIIKTLNINASITLLSINNILSKTDKFTNLKIIVTSSVAGDRGKKSTLLYGSSKSLISTYLEGLIQKYSDSNICIYDLKLGPTKTKMTKNLKQGFLYSSPKNVSNKIYKIIQKKKSTISYVPFWWQIIMFIIKLTPNFIFHKIKL